MNEIENINVLNKKQQVARVLVITLVLNIVVALTKILIGLISGALAITADGFHSLLDGMSNIVALVGNHIAARPPDSDHPYGHRRFETLAALLIGIFMILTAWEVGRGALQQFSHIAAIELSSLTFFILLMTLLVNLFVTRYQLRQGHRLESDLLLTDAEHTRSDLYVTGSVLISSGLVWLTGWFWLDRVVALIVVVLIGRIAWRVLWETGSVLVDTAPYTPEKLVALIYDIPGIDEVVRARSRGSRTNASVGIDVQVSSHMTTAQTAAISNTIRQRIQDRLSQIGEVEVHFVPQKPQKADYAMLARAEADRLGLRTHEVSTTVVDGVNLLEMHVEVPAEQTLVGAHEQVTQLEQSLIEQITEIDEVVSHIEPVQPQRTDVIRLADSFDVQLHERILELLRLRFPQVDWHHSRIYTHGDSVALSIHAALQSHTSVEDAHTLAERAEVLIRSEMPRISRVTIHTEPLEAVG